jgi:uncharacterized protein YjbJ (UPF0337 family)
MEVSAPAFGSAAAVAAPRFAGGVRRRTSARNLYMNMTELKGRWNELQGKLKQKYSNLTDDDLMFVEGKEDEMFGRLQTRLGKTKEAIRRELEDL